jgi:two-component system response regulator YesN
MFTLLTADDEPDKLEALHDMFDWDKYDIKIIGQAHNGQEAYDLLMELRPDIGIMDIRMPVMSGLEAIQRATENGVKTKYVILSGYDEFDYARKALQLQTVEYLLKPCRVEEITQAVLKAANQVEEERNKKKLLDEYRQLFVSNAKNLKERFMINLASGGIDASEDIQSKIKAFELESLFECYAVCTVSLVNDQDENENKNLLFLNLMRIAESMLTDIARSEVFLLKEQVVIIVSLSDISVRFYMFQDALFNILEETRQQYNAQGVIGVSDLKESPRLLYEAYIEAIEAASLAAFDGIHEIRYYAELNKTVEAFYPSQNEKDVISAVIGESGEISLAIDSFFNNYSLSSAETRKIIQQMASTLVCSIFMVCLEHNLILKQFSKMLSDTIEEISKSRTMQEIKSIVLRFALEVSKSFTGNKQISALTSMAIQYIRENYAKKINLEMTAEMLHISPTYLSMLFKQTGMNFIEYLNRYRIQQSKEYLKDIDKKVYEVANKIGIQDEKYFHSLFKRYTGLTATQYRDSFIYNRNQGIVM